MTDFLVVAGISIDTIDEIKKNNNLLFELYSNKEEVIAICNYLRKIGVNNIDDIIIYRPDMFLETESSVNYYFSKFEIKDIVNKINEDYLNIDLVLNKE